MKRTLWITLLLMLVLSLYCGVALADGESVHSYALSMALDKFYDGAPVEFKPASDLSIDGGETSWDAESMSLRWAEYGDGVLQYLGNDAEGNSLVPTLPGQYALTIWERGEDDGWVMAVSFEFSINWSSAEILEVTNFSHYYHTGQYYEGAFVLWKDDITLNGVPIQEPETYYENYSDALLENMGIQIIWLDGSREAIIDYDSPNSHYFNGPARVSRQYTVKVTQTIGGETRDISAPLEFTVTPTAFYKVTDHEAIESGARWYLYSIMGEMDGQLYVMSMPDAAGAYKQPAIPVYPGDDGSVWLGWSRENVFALQWKGYTFNGHRLYLFTTGTAWDIFITGGNDGSISRGRYNPTGDEGFYIGIDPNNNYAATMYEPNMGHGPFLLAKDSGGNVFFTRGLYNNYDSPRSDLGIVETAPVYLYWNQVSEVPPSGQHSYEFLGTPYDKEYDGEPLAFDENKNISVDGGKTSWAELEKAGVARLVWEQLEGKEWLILKGAPSEVGIYTVVIQEFDKKDWSDVASEYFEITGSASFTVSFYTLVGSLPVTQTVTAGESAIRPDDPVRDGWWFVGWYTDETLETPFDFDTAITADTALFAKWAQPDLILPSSLTEIGEEAFADGSFTSAEPVENTGNNGEETTAGGSFTFVELSENTVKIGARAFAGRTKLSYIVIPAERISIEPDAFEGITGLTIFGKAGSDAQTFAAEHQFIFIPLPETAGDA